MVLLQDQPHYYLSANSLFAHRKHVYVGTRAALASAYTQICQEGALKDLFLHCM